MPASRAARCCTAGRPTGLRDVAASRTARYLFAERRAARARRRARRRAGSSCAGSRATTCTTSTRAFRSGVFTAVTGVSGSGKSSLVSQALVELVCAHLGPRARASGGRRRRRPRPRSCCPRAAGCMPAPSAIRRLVRVDQKPIGRTPRSNLATYTGLFDARAQALRRDAGGAQAALRRRPLLVQRRQGPLRDLRGRGLRQRRAAVHAQRLRALPDLPRRALQRGDARRSPGTARTSPTCSR